LYRSVSQINKSVRERESLGNSLIKIEGNRMTMTETKLTGEVSKVDRSIDRLKTCPLLLRVFCNKNRHHLARFVYLYLIF